MGEDDPNRVTLSGLLNFVDGLWSCCGDERIFVFTTNHVEKLDKALLRPGRMDMQIELSYCTFPAFRVLANNYLSVEDHPLFEKLESAFLGKTLTPAHIAELLIKDKSNVDIALESVLSALENNVPESPEAVSTPDHAVSKDSASTFGNDKASNHDPDMDNSSAKNVSKEDLVSVLQGVIEVLEKSTDTPSLATCRQPAAASSSNVKDCAHSVQSAFLKNASDGKLDSAIEGVIQALSTKLSMSEIQQIFNVKPTADKRSGSSSKAAASNGVPKEMENGEIK